MLIVNPGRGTARRANALQTRTVVSAVAHEIAHLTLGHPPADLFTDAARDEDAAAAKVREWGFEGIDD
jgi:hypothetical protein